ncbi:SusC/RagA family TonB-linked outer membrane protein [Flammeovirga agarivorans]|uniref:SusC/RagA family TonB-linked outer membrane protein n=1 Tax=Flammeovirga agarivorans TaxID=2726742 RepID=A0A7X8XYN0_9BACT|nr:SusC/RagA family TonB-linked outer membrane protein [Flammeovirga agarivorans]NLR94366.1 SusC/RagA family TonB-linked outer membrane protein [Flammeovirga agarivorans]
MKLKLLFLLLMSLCSSGILTAQVEVEKRIITGQVFSEEDNISLPGVNVRVKGTNYGTITDITGNYSLNVDTGDTLVFSYIGMVSKEISIANQKVVDVSLEVEVEHLKEVVVTALGISREKESLSYATQGVEGESLTEVKQADVITNLAGRVAGVQITGADSPTGTSRVVIRGATSLTKDNQPLYVVDGVPIDSEGGDTGVSLAGGSDNIDYGGATSFINPEDIADIQVLKGANAAALYGSRAANGVIMITTKKSSSANESWGVTYGLNYQIREITQYPDFQNVYGAGSNTRVGSSQNHFDYETGLPDLYNFRRSWGAPMVGQEVLSYNGQVGTYDAQPNNIKDFFQRGRNITNNLTLQKKGEKGSLYLSYSNMDATDIIEGSNLQVRNTFNVRTTRKFTKYLEADVKVTYVSEKTTNRIQKNGSEKNPYNSFIYMHRNVKLEELSPWKDEFGNEIGQVEDFFNPYWAMNENKNEDTQERFLPVVSLKSKISKDLNVRVRVGGDVRMRKGYVFSNMGAALDPDGMYQMINRNTQVWNYEGFINYKKRFGKIDFFATAGASRFDKSIDFTNSVINTLIVPDVPSASNAATLPIVTQGVDNKRIHSVFATSSIGYNNVIYLDLSARNDWSSSLPEGHNSYFYPSLGTSFVFTNALDIGSSVLSFGKIRGSIAQVGNDTGFNELNNTFNYGGNYNGMAWVTNQTMLRNPDLRPETTNSWEIGSELKFFNNRISLDATYYNNRTYDQIIRIDLPSGAGYQTKMINAGEIQNRGVELTLGVSPVQTNNFQWDMMVNWSKNISKVNSLYKDPASGAELDRIEYRGYSTVSVNAEVGYPFGVIRGEKWLTDDEGNKLVSPDGLPIANPNQILGNAQPDWLGSINNSFRFKNFDLSFLIDVKMGGDLYSVSRSKAETWGNTANTVEGREDYWFSSIVLGENASERNGDGLYGTEYDDSERSKGILLDAYEAVQNPETGEWEKVGKNTTYVSPQNFFQTGTSNAKEFNLYDASYVKLRQVSIGYNIPKSFLKRLKIEAAKVSAVGRNLWIIYQNTPHGLDPEAASYSGNGQGIELGSLPPTSSLGLDFRVSF